MSCQQNAGQNDNTKIANKSFQNVEKFKYLMKTLPNQNYMHKEIKSSLKSGNACYHSVRDILPSFSPSRSIKIKMQYMELYFCVFCMGVNLGPSHYVCILRVFESRVLRRMSVNSFLLRKELTGFRENLVMRSCANVRQGG
jgi:hypothetical protein